MIQTALTYLMSLNVYRIFEAMHRWDQYPS